MNTMMRSCGLATLVAISVMAEPVLAGEPAVLKPVLPVKQSITPPAVVPARPLTGPVDNLIFPQAKTELKRLMVGNQAGIVKILGPNREGVAYARGIDDKNIARYGDDACCRIFEALAIPQNKLDQVTQEIMTNYSTLPRKEAVAFLAAAAASPYLSVDMDSKTEDFLIKVMQSDKDVYARRQAVLALAVKHKVALTTTDRVLELYEQSENLWETFPVQQYFEYHAPQVKNSTDFLKYRKRIAAVKSLYTPAILECLDAGKPVTVIP